MMRMVMDTKKMRIYIIDLPRAMKKEHLFQFFSGIETLKDGYAYDDRYKFKEEYFDSPNIWVFMNIIPEESYLSTDRWKIWRIDTNKNLVGFEDCDKPESRLSNYINEIVYVIYGLNTLYGFWALRCNTAKSPIIYLYLSF